MNSTPAVSHHCSAAHRQNLVLSSHPDSAGWTQGTSWLATQTEGAEFLQTVEKHDLFSSLWHVQKGETRKKNTKPLPPVARQH